MTQERRQFSLGYLFLEVSLFAVSLGSFRAVSILTDSINFFFWAGLVLLAFSSGGAAVGGLFGKMTCGVYFAWIVFVVAMLLPAIQAAD